MPDFGRDTVVRSIFTSIIVRFRSQPHVSTWDAVHARVYGFLQDFIHHVTSAEGPRPRFPPEHPEARLIPRDAVVKEKHLSDEVLRTFQIDVRGDNNRDLPISHPLQEAVKQYLTNAANYVLDTFGRHLSSWARR